MKFLAIIPARYASTRFPAKPLAMLGGKPVIQHVYERVSSILDAVVATDDERIRDAFVHAKEMGVEYEYIIDETTATNHPNTADIDIVGVTGQTLSIRGESIGGGKMKIVRINNIKVMFTGEYSTLIVHQQDKPGVVAHITQALSEQNVNIAFMRLFRENKGANAYTVVESDHNIPEEVLDKIRTNPNVDNLMLIQL